MKTCSVCGKPAVAKVNQKGLCWKHSASWAVFVGVHRDEYGSLEDAYWA